MVYTVFADFKSDTPSRPLSLDLTLCVFLLLQSCAESMPDSVWRLKSRQTIGKQRNWWEDAETRPKRRVTRDAPPLLNSSSKRLSRCHISAPVAETGADESQNIHCSAKAVE